MVSARRSKPRKQLTAGCRRMSVRIRMLPLLQQAFRFIYNCLRVHISTRVHVVWKECPPSVVLDLGRPSLPQKASEYTWPGLSICTCGPTSRAIISGRGGIESWLVVSGGAIIRAKGHTRQRPCETWQTQCFLRSVIETFASWYIRSETIRTGRRRVVNGLCRHR